MPLIDLHCHLLPGIDDGPESMDDSVSLAVAYLAAGITRVAATPHVNLRHENDSSRIMQTRFDLIERLGNENIDLTVEQGAEISADVTAGLDDNELRRLTLGAGEWLLVEPPTRATSFTIHKAVFDVQQRGFRVLLAHPERNPALQADLDLVADLVATGTRTQITAEALTGRYGPEADKTARQLFDRDLVHTIASDAHHATERPPGLEDELRRSGYGELVGWLCRDMPAWILDGGEEPARPDSGGNERTGRGILGRLGFNG